MRDTCGLLIAGQGAARGDRRATGESEGSADIGQETRRHAKAELRSSRRHRLRVHAAREKQVLRSERRDNWRVDEGADYHL
jgi:hypothetical protein